MNETVNLKKPVLYKPANISLNVNEYVSVLEQFKSKIPEEEYKNISAKLNDLAGEEHPFDYSIVEGLEKKFGVVSAIEDKICDYTLGPGMFFECDDEKALDFLNIWTREKHLEIHLRPWFKNGLGKGTGYLEVAGLVDKEVDEAIKLIDPDSVYIKRDEYGKITEINQVLSKNISISEKNINPLEKENIIQLNINQISNCAYGHGIVYSGIYIIDDFLNAQKAVHTLMRRKSNSPIHAKLGNVEKDDYPRQEDIDSFGKNLQFMNETTEWVTGPNVEMNVLDFGNIGEKFKDVLDNDMKLLSYAFQVPEAILGADKGFVGSTKIQDNGFDKNINSYQKQIGYVLKTQLYDKLLEKYGFGKVVYNIVWGKQSDNEKNLLRQSYLNVLSSTMLSPGMKLQYEKKLALLDEIDFKEVEIENTKQLRRENRDKKKTFNQQVQLQQVKKTPFEQNEYILKHEIENKILLGKAPQEIEAEIVKDFSLSEKIAYEIVKEEIDEFEKDYTLEEWIGEYVQIKKEILERIQGDTFANLAAQNAKDRTLGLLNKKQIEKVRKIMTSAFEENKGLKQIANEFSKIKLKDRYIMKNGKKILSVSADKRSYQMARTETVRLRAEGTLISMENKNKGQVEFTLVSARPCPECEALNGDIYTVNEAYGVIPVHSSCRCKWSEA